MRKTFDKLVLGTSAFALAFLATSGTGASAASSAVDPTSATDPADAAVPARTTVVNTPTTLTVAATPTTLTVVNTPMTAIAAAMTPASTREYYNTSSNLKGTDGVGFNAVTAGSFGLNSQVSLGEFTVSLPDGAATKTFDHTPFSITYNPVKVADTVFGINSPVTISGTLTGTVSGDTSDLKAQFNAVPVKFSTPKGEYDGTISVLDNPLSLVPSSAGGRTTIQAIVTTTAPLPIPAGGGQTNTPEPTTLAILATSLVGLGLRHRLHSARKPA